MDQKFKETLAKGWIPLLSLLLSLGVTVGGGLVNNKIQTALMEEKIAILQRDAARHEMEKGEQIRSNTTKAEEHEKRIIRLEANFGVIQETLADMKSDLKILLRGAKQ
ncbi:hypothetical protein [Desulfovibrio sp.]|uniref:hypothetical protein n=1 Tax=Desulfovibrio sp. TaxID=885 RepID=UPI0023C1C891|nr:hypothetical protein [Desulfovibrio sp.]MDE7240277.1 hypothetical protein [Desulfovibrio sp.]